MSSVKISQTLNEAAGNFARPTKFNVLLAPPKELTSTDNKSFDVLCKEVTIPETTMEPVELIYKGHTIKVPGRVKQEQTISITFLLDEYHILRKTFSDWIHGMDPRSPVARSTAAASLSESVSQMGTLIIATRDFNETDNQPMNYFFEGVFPISVSGPNFGSANNNEIIEITVSFAYYRFLQKTEMADEFDDLDSVLDKFGVPAVGSSLSKFSALRDLAGSTNNIIGNISNIANVLNF